MASIIGLDFGNYNSFACFIDDFQERDRMSGHISNLVDDQNLNGWPSAYFYSKTTGERFGKSAVDTAAVPMQNRRRYLKMHLGEKTVIDGMEIGYADIITKLVGEIVNDAARIMKQDTGEMTNKIALAFPATFNCNQKRKLIECVERAELFDGDKYCGHPEVCGTIAEPAAAGLNWLAEKKVTEDTTILTYDLGGGTFDAALVALYPQGRKDPQGNAYYYDIICTDGNGSLGGQDFNSIIEERISETINGEGGSTDSEGMRSIIARNAEEGKRILCSQRRASDGFSILYNNDMLDIPITRDEFEEANMGLMQETIRITKEMIESHRDIDIKAIILTGGASQMPMVKRCLSEALPSYSDKIILYSPYVAVAHGTARYGTSEIASKKDAPKIKLHTAYALGIRFKDENGYYIYPYVDSGKDIPFSYSNIQGAAAEGQHKLDFAVYEATRPDPDGREVRRDWKHILTVSVDFGKPVAAGTSCYLRLSMNRLGTLSIEARDGSRPDAPVMRNEVRFEDLV